MLVLLLVMGLQDHPRVGILEGDAVVREIE